MFNGKRLESIERRLEQCNQRQNAFMSSLDGVHMRIDDLQASFENLQRSVVAMSKANSDRLIEMAMVKQGQAVEAVQHRRAAAGENMQNVRESPVDDTPESLDDFPADMEVLDLIG